MLNSLTSVNIIVPFCVSSNSGILQNILSSNRGSTKVIQNGDEILIGFVTNERTGWKIVNTVSYNDLLDKMGSNIRHNIILISVFLLIFILLALAIGFTITRPIQRIRQLMHQIDAGKLNETVEIKSNDEIGQLGRSFNTMLRQIKELIEKVREEQNNKQQLKFEALQAQINPHFLFNTLNTIKWNALINQDKSTADMLKSLGTILEESMQKTSDYTTLSKELEVLKSYLFIQKVRYNQRFKVSFSVDDDTLNCRILRFLLQPVVENALIHGMNEEFTEIHISISAGRYGDKLLITVEDDGAGIKAERLKSLTEWVNNSNEKKQYSGIGIRNVHERIILHYGEGYGLKILSEEGRGTTVQISIPIEKGEFTNENIDH